MPSSSVAPFCVETQHLCLPQCYVWSARNMIIMFIMIIIIMDFELNKTKCGGGDSSSRRYIYTIPLLHHAFYMYCQFHSPRLEHFNYMWWRVKVEAIHYEIITKFLLFHSLLVQIISSAPCSQIPSVHILLLMSETKFHTPYITTGKIIFHTFYFITFIQQTKRQQVFKQMEESITQNLICS
jgi:hypothetical protein